jgi:hypothetical protein
VRFLRFSLTLLSDANCDDGTPTFDICWERLQQRRGAADLLACTGGERWTVCTRLNIALDSLHGVREAGRSPLVRAGSKLQATCQTTRGAWMRRLSLDEIVRSAKQKAERLANRGGSFSRLRGPLWSIFDDAADEVAAINDRERRFRCCLELMSVCKDVGVMPSCASSCIFTLCSATEDTLLHWPAKCEDDCATLRGLTIKLHSAIGRLAEGGGWGEDETAALMKNWFTDAPEEVRFLPWDPGTEIEWSSDSSCKSWRAAVVVDRWHLRDTLRQEAMLANIPPGQLRLAATTTADERAAAVQLRASGTVLSAGGAVDAAKFPPVSIEMGRQKYVLIRLLTEPVTHLVRGVCGIPQGRCRRHCSRANRRGHRVHHPWRWTNRSVSFQHLHLWLLLWLSLGRRPSSRSHSGAVPWGIPRRED